MASIENKGDAEVGFGISAAILFLCGRENGGAASIVLVVVGAKGKWTFFSFSHFPSPLGRLIMDHQDSWLIWQIQFRIFQFKN